MTTFQPGQLVYAASGAAFRYICPVNSAHAVHPIFNFDSDEDESNEELGHPEVLHAVFASPPREKLDIELEHLKQLITAKQAELLELQKAMRVEMSQDRKQALEAHSTLVFIADWLLGTELWAVTRAYSTYVVRCVKNGKDGMALHVYRKKTGKPQFVAFDGLGSEREVISIHKTEGEANAALRGVLESQLAQYIKADMGVSADLLDLVKQAQRDGVQIPEQIEKVVTAYKATKVREEIEATEKSVSEAKQRIAQLKEKL